MKNQIVLAFVCLACLGAALYSNNDERQATVKKTDGYYMFIECKPNDPYEVVGTVSHGMTMTNSYTSRKKSFLKKVARYYPAADGYYYDPKVTGTYEAFVIKFK